MNVFGVFCCRMETFHTDSSLIRRLYRRFFSCSRQASEMAACSFRRNDAPRAQSPLSAFSSPDFRFWRKHSGQTSVDRRGLNMWFFGTMNIGVFPFYLGLFRGVFLESLARQQTLNLSGKWVLSNSNASVSVAAEVPGCVHTALQKRGFIQVKSHHTAPFKSLAIGGV